MIYVIQNGLLVKYSLKKIFSYIFLSLFFLSLFSFLFNKIYYETYQTELCGKVLIKKEFLEDLQLIQSSYSDLLIENEYLLITQKKYDEIFQENLKLQKLSIYESETQLNEIFDIIFDDVKISKEKKDLYIQAITKYSEFYDLPAVLIASIIWRESRFNEKLISKSNAKGPMQIIAKYHREKLKQLNKNEDDLLSIDTGISIGCWILREYYDKNNRDIFVTLFRYVGAEKMSYAKDIIKKYIDSKIYLKEKIKQETSNEK